MVRAAGLEPAQAFRPYGFSYHFGFRRHREVFVVWTIPSPRQIAVGAARLVSTPSSWRRLGSGLPFERFPRIWAVLHPGFPARALNQSLKSVASASSATPAYRSLHSPSRLGRQGVSFKRIARPPRKLERRGREC